MAKIKYIDPPEGWKYGFPKPMPESPVDLSEWLFGEGYPADLIPLAMKYSRYWEEEVDV
jgi:hypothetical protein